MRKIALLSALLFIVISSRAQTVASDSLKGTTSEGAKQGGLAISPATMFFTAPKGEVGKQVIQIVNNQDKAYTFQINATEWDLDSVGNSIHYQDSGHVSNSCVPWVTFSPNIITVEPGQTGNVLATIKVPDEESAAKQSHWCAVNVTLSMDKLAPQKISPTASVSFTPLFNVILHIFETPPTATDKDLRMIDFGFLKDFKTSDTSEAINVIRIAGENTGSVMLRPLFSAKLSSMTTGKTISLERPNCMMFPGNKRIVYLKIPNDLPKGKYLVVASIDGGDDVPLEVTQKEINIE